MPNAKATILRQIAGAVAQLARIGLSERNEWHTSVQGLPGAHRGACALFAGLIVQLLLNARVADARGGSMDAMAAHE
ncbi:MAG: hypothetical protein R3B13_39860 [Polyangiaceae bacterium]